MNVSYELRKQIAEHIYIEMSYGLPSYVNSNQMESIIKEACMLALYDYIEFNVNDGFISPEEFYESI